MSGVPNVFGSATSSIPLSQLDVNFNTPLYIGNTSVGLGNTVTSFGNVTLTNATISGNLTATSITGGTANGVVYLSSGNVVTANPTVLDFDGTNLGLGVTPSAWQSGIKVLQIGSYSSLGFDSANSTFLGNNWTYSSATYKYLNSNYATYYIQTGSGQHQWYTAPSGTAGNAITFTQAMTLNNSGSLAFGVSGQGITGTTTNDNATTGVVGEYIVSTVVNTSVSLTTNTATNVTSISLTAGDWDVQANVQYNVGATTNMTYWYSTISTTSATLATSSAAASNMVSSTAAGTVFGATAFTLASPVTRISLSSTTTVYLVTQAGFTVSTLQAGGTIRARRVR